MYDLWYQISRDPNIGINLFVENIIQVVYGSLLRPKDVAIDGGANRGLHTKPMLQAVGKEGLVLAFEAVPKLASELQAVLKGVDGVKIINKALGRKVGQTEFVYVKDAHTRSGIKEQEGLSETLRSSVERIQIDLTTIDFETERLGVQCKVRFIKLDLEGGEFDALEGAVSVLASARPFLVFENGRSKAAKLYQYEPGEWFSFFEEYGYVLFDIFGRPFSVDHWGKPGIPPYCMATRRAEDTLFVNETLPNLISALYLPYKRLMDTLSGS